jgi:hypothetical protein
METINKTIFMKAYQCSKAAYLYVKHPELRSDNLRLESLFRKGNEVDLEARKLFPLGIDITEGYKPFSEYVQYTDSLIADGTRILYQPCFQYENLRCKADILVTGEKVWKLYEVKSGTSRQDEYVLDAAYQARIIKSCYPDVKLETYLIYINSEYVRGEELNLEDLFVIENVTHRVKMAQQLVTRYLKIANDTLKKKSLPDVDISTKCTNPYECEFKKECWKHIPEGESVFDISRMWETKKHMLYAQNIIHMRDVPRQLKLNDKQWMQIDCTIQKRTVTNPEAIEKFLSDIEFPLFFMDYETIQHPIVPEYLIGVKVNEQVPFQFSVHRLDAFHLKEIHSDFLAKPNVDSRVPFIEALLKSVKSHGTIFAYNAKFEIMILKQIATAFPKYKKKIADVIKRTRDLMEPFEQRYLYHFSQAGSVSLKKILPAWVPGLSYDGLAVSNGNMASEGFYKLSNSKLSKKEKDEIKYGLLEYCHLDTLALVKLLLVLKDIVDESKRRGESLPLMDHVLMPGKPIVGLKRKEDL